MGQTAPGDRPASVAGDSGLRCPKCEYNLTGVAENRCPECGNTFDWAGLQAALSVAPLPIPVLEDQNRPPVFNMVRMCLRTWFLPWRVGAEFPPRHRLKTVVLYRRTALMAAVAVMAAPGFIHNSHEYACATIAAIFGGIVGLLVTEWVITTLLIMVLVPNTVQEPVSLPVGVDHSYHGLVTLFRSYLILTALAGVVWANVPLGIDQRDLSIQAFLGLMIWWWAALSSAIVAQPVRPGGKLVCVLLIPPIAAGGITIAAMVAIPVGAAMILP